MEPAHTCQICQQPATVFLTQIIGEESKKIPLCLDCSNENNITDPTHITLINTILQHPSHSSSSKKNLPPTPPTPSKLKESHDLSSIIEEEVCPNCQFTQSDFKNTGRLGCSQCYDTFTEGMDEVVESIHNHTHHQGKIPEKHQARLEHLQELNAIREQLQEAVKNEKYELAATLRDKVSQLEFEAKHNQSL